MPAYSTLASHPNCTLTFCRSAAKAGRPMVDIKAGPMARPLKPPSTLRRVTNMYASSKKTMNGRAQYACCSAPTGAHPRLGDGGQSVGRGGNRRDHQGGADR